MRSRVSDGFRTQPTLQLVDRSVNSPLSYAGGFGPRHQEPERDEIMFGTTPFGSLKYHEIHGSKMAYIDEGAGNGSCSSTATRHRRTYGAM